MNSYPPELLAQLAPVMFVAGLDVQEPASTIASAPGEAPTPPRTVSDPFDILSLRLRDALVAQRKPAIWQPERNKTFQVVLVDKDVRFPPRKIGPPNEPQHSAIFHSPLSPLTPTSPLFPDGIIAPIWVRKHTALIPSVFVLFARLYESPPSHLPRSPLDPPHPDRDSEERRKDAELSVEIAQRKKVTSERGIKLTVVLIASRKMLDDPTLDTRLTFIRRQSGLDSRAALFVLSPVSLSELNEFVKSLQQALYDPAVEYYTSHSKRVRRKRNRHAQVVGASSYIPPHSPLGGANAPRPLRPEGWTVRYEYKMACFAEFRGEDEVALKHYQDAYSTLVIMFGSTVILPPRTKRWAEAKVLADCINIKICKLYLYNNEHALALSQHNMHMRKYGDFSRGWGIGEETFEFWSWIARQHRVFAELLEQGMRSSLILPTNLPTSPQAQVGLEDAVRVLGLNPATALQHPGFYFYMAAGATEKRRERFLVIDSAGSSTNAPGLANERKVDHHTIVLELYTKSYELFKKYSTPNVQGQGRLTLRIAYRIAQTYYESGKFDMAVRFFERIAKTYRREKWGVMLKPLLSTWYACAQQLGDVDLSVRLLVEMLGHVQDGVHEEESIQEDLLTVLKTTVPSEPDKPLEVDLSESHSIFDSSVVFWKSEAAVNERVAFQVSLTTAAHAPISSLPFSSLALYFSHRTQPVVVRHSCSEDEGAVQIVDIGNIASGGEEDAEVEGILRWKKGGMVVFAGTVVSDIPATLRIVKAVVTLKESDWVIDIPIEFSALGDDTASTLRWLSSVDPVTFVPVRGVNHSEVSIRHRPHELQVSFSHQSPAYLDEEYPIIMDITNLYDRTFEVVVDVLLQPTEIDDAVNSIRIDEERSSGLVKGVSLGLIAPGVTVLKTLYLTNAGAAGDRILDISIQSHVPTGVPIDALRSPLITADTSERLQTLVIPTVGPVQFASDVTYMRSRKPLAAWTDLSSYESDYGDESVGGQAVVSTSLHCVGPHGLSVEKARLVRKNGPHARVVDCSLDEDEDDVASEWLPGDEFAAVTSVSLAVEEDAEEGDAVAGPGEYELTWRRVSPNGDHGPLCISTFPLPFLTPPRDGLIALLSLPSHAKLHVPVHAYLTVRNLQPTRTASIHVSLEPDVGDAFLAAGMRTGRLPALLPGAEEHLVWTLTPVECGFVRVPKIKVVDKRTKTADGTGTALAAEDQGVLVKVLDVRRDGRDERGESKGAGETGEAGGSEASSAIGPILVLP